MLVLVNCNLSVHGSWDNKYKMQLHKAALDWLRQGGDMLKDM